jgi:hypothetical protein
MHSRHLNKEVSIQLHAPVTLTPCIRWIRGWVGPRTNLDVAANRKVPVPARKLTLVFQSVASHFSHGVITALCSTIHFNIIFSFTLRCPDLSLI